MSRSSEARFWQAVGATVGVVGALLMAYDFAEYGFASIVPRALMLGLSGSFLMLAGEAAFLSGRALHVEETVLTGTESKLWIALGLVCIFGGAITVGLAWVERSLILDRLATGLAGSFSILFGVIAVVGQRVMSHMHDALAAKAAVAGR